MADTVRYECANCAHPIKDTPVERRWIENHGRFVAQNLNAPRSQVSYTWNALLPHWVEWRSIVQEFLAAMDAMRIDADIEPMYTFVTETLGEPWETERWGVANDERILERKGDYNFNDPWPLEEIRFLAVDGQQKGGEHYFWVCRAFGKGGVSRLIAYGRCNTTAEVEELRKQLNVKTSNPVIDSGYKAAEVYRFCAATGWKPFKGDDAEWFLTLDKRTGKSLRRMWRKVWVDSTFGQKRDGTMRGNLPLYQWSNPSVKDHLALFSHGVGGQWTVPKSTGQDYFDQMTAEVREEREDSHGRIRHQWVQKRRDNHCLDCELMILVAAIITGYVKTATLQASESQQKSG